MSSFDENTTPDVAPATSSSYRRWVAVSLPLLVSTFVLLHFFFVNFVELEVADVATTLALVLSWALVLYAIAYAVLRDSCKASLVSTLGLFSFYGHQKLVFSIFFHFRKVGAGMPLKGTYDIPHELQLGILIALVVLVCGSAAVISRVRTDLYGLTAFFWRCSLAAIVISTVSGLHTIRSMPRPVLEPPVAHKTDLKPDQKPDIYIIILDAFGRPDVLEKRYGFSVQPFTEKLNQQGFHVFSDSRSNFPTTAYSLSSELNFTYLDKDSVGLGVDYPQPFPYPLISLRENNRLARFLKQQGYQIINIYGGGDFTRRFSVTDLCLGSNQGVNGCTYLFLRHTPLSVLSYRWLQVPELDRRRVAVLEALKELRQLPGKTQHPCFVMVHLLCPHDPFFLDENGGRPFADPNFDWEGTREFAKGYAGQAKFLSGQVADISAEILKKSTNPPVIIIQGDHGPMSLSNNLQEQFADRFPNFCAMHLPEKNYAELPETLTPVNYFRYILNRYFDTRLEILPNHSYYLPNASKPFLYEEVSEYIQSPSGKAATTPVNKEAGGKEK